MGDSWRRESLDESELRYVRLTLSIAMLDPSVESNGTLELYQFADIEDELQYFYVLNSTQSV